MCTKKKYQSREIDTCIRSEVLSINTARKINVSSQYQTLLSCCGHGEYPKTIVVLDKGTYEVFEWFTKHHLSKGIRKGRRYYKSDKNGHYFIPELQNDYKKENGNIIDT